MFCGFSQEALDFLLGIKLNNNKEWFEERKSVYTDKIYHPLKALGEELFAPFSDVDGMMYKVGRIYRDDHFPPYLHYRDTLWIYVRYDAWNWSRTPTLYFELSSEGAEIGFRISNPEAAVMERFRSQLSEDSEPFLSMVNDLEKRHGIVIGGDEYKRKKLCTVPEAERFFLKKSLSAYVKVTDPAILFTSELSRYAVEIFKAVQPLNDYFNELVELEELSKSLLRESETVPGPEPPVGVVQAPQKEFMW